MVYLHLKQKKSKIRLDYVVRYSWLDFSDMIATAPIKRDTLEVVEGSNVYEVEVGGEDIEVYLEEWFRSKEMYGLRYMIYDIHYDMKGENRWYELKGRYICKEGKVDWK